LDLIVGLHHGVGRGLGAIIGGMMVSTLGTTSTFRFYGFVCFVTLAIFVYMNWKAGGLGSNINNLENNTGQL